MENNISYDGGFKFKPDYKWPEKSTKKECPRCNEQLELIENRKTYFGKPWWCVPCQWQFSEEDLLKAKVDSLEEE
jgi:transposase-like protein